ncbi:MAG: DUF3341 domain-containing protein [Cyclobacteriaceae bacterium]|nr:DUF3341 domain-containing protein [Cyclobacteriaceae bacterium]MCH8515176.1 DUF3341 domain-containing protein [Cyclobacteriaceae bacterium]
MEKQKNYILGVYDDEDVLLKGVTKVRDAGVKIEEVYSPYPVHGLDERLGYKRSRLPVVAFLFGMTGTTLAILMQVFMMSVDWQMIIGGKDFLPYPTFVPVTFEMTVLLAALGMVGTFVVIEGLRPYAKPRIFDLRSSDHLHIMAIDLAINKDMDEDKLQSVLKDSGAVEINRKDFE